MDSEVDWKLVEIQGSENFDQLCKEQMKYSHQCCNPGVGTGFNILVFYLHCEVIMNFLHQINYFELKKYVKNLDNSIIKTCILQILLISPENGQKSLKIIFKINYLHTYHLLCKKSYQAI